MSLYRFRLEWLAPKNFSLEIFPYRLFCLDSYASLFLTTNKGNQIPANNKEINKMTKPDFMLDPEDDMLYVSASEIEELAETFQIIGLDSDRRAYNDYDYDSDNYGYDY